MFNLRNELIRLAHSQPKFRKDLLSLLSDTKTASNEMSLRSAIIRLAYQKSDMRDVLIPLAKEAGLMDKLKDMIFKNKETGKDNKFTSLPADQQKEIREKAKEEIEEKEEKSEKKEEKKEEKSEGKKEEKAPEGTTERARPDISNPSDLSDEDLDTAIKSMQKDLDDVRGQLHLIHQGRGYPQAQQEFEKMEKEMSDKMKPLTDELGSRDKKKQEKAEEEKKKKEEEAKKKQEEAAAKEKARRDSLTPEERKKEDDEKEAKKKRDQENARMMEEYYMNQWTGRAASDSELRGKVIRLAHSNPKIRKDILPLLTKESASTQSHADVTTIWFKQFSNDMKNYRPSVKIIETTNYYVRFMANGKVWVFEMDGALKLWLKGSVIDKWSPNANPSQIIRTIFDEHIN